MQYIAGISISLFLVALLLNKRHKSRSDIILFIWMLVNAIQLSLQFMFVNGQMLEYPFLYGFIAPLPLFHGICLYLYVASVTNHFPKKKIYMWSHLLPPLFAFLYLLRYFFFLPQSQQTALLESEGQGHELFVIILFSSVMLSGVVYIIWSILLLRKHRQNILDQFSEIERVNLKWLQFLIYGLAIVWSVVIFSQNDEYIYVVVVVFVILTGFFGIQQIDIFKERTLHTSKSFEQEQGKSPPKYAKSGLTENRSQELYDKLQSLLEREKVYKQQELSVSDLAEKLDIHSNYLSQVINEKTGKSFYDFINTYRIEDFKKLVAEPANKKFTLLSLAYESGFNSKSSFNRYFKKATGQTPTQYLKQFKTS